MQKREIYQDFPSDDFREEPQAVCLAPRTLFPNRSVLELL